MQTAAISYRVADFLQKFPPFQSMEEEDLVALAGRGRVKFHESDEFVYWQGNPAGPHVFVVQQGTLRLVEEAGGKERLCDIRGAGDLLGIDSFLDDGEEGGCYRQSAKTASDVILYALPRNEFAALLARYPEAARYLKIHGSVSPDFAGLEETRPLSESPLFDAVRGREAVTCGVRDPVSKVAALLRDHAVEAIAVLEETGRIAGVISRDQILEWAAGGMAGTTAAQIMAPVGTVPVSAALSDGVLAMSRTGNVVALTEDGTASGELSGLVTTTDLHFCFGDRPGDILNCASRARNTDGLREANFRARAFFRSQLGGAGATEWLAELASIIDCRIVRRLITLEGGEGAGCWFFHGAAGRREQITAAAPPLALIAADDGVPPVFGRVMAALGECGYLPGPGGGEAAGLQEWTTRFANWIADPIPHEISERRALFDQLPVAGDRSLWLELWKRIESAVASDAVFVRLLAHDSLSTLPPLTFFRGFVVDFAGREHEQFELEKHMLTPIADCARVFGLAAGKGAGSSTRERLAVARARHPDREAVFREAAWTLQLALQIQSREGVRHGNTGGQVRASTLSRYEQQLLKRGFDSIGRLLEFAEGSYGLGF
ncbi:MAG: putative nucleotidyltransferase substrate binding domain-containing protein [Bryobacteraceae bacterium]|nr:putative nucleotidyltransferase substrate binding domain-containing protein [Bryobacteraceae bacterium]